MRPTKYVTFQQSQRFVFNAQKILIVEMQMTIILNVTLVPKNALNQLVSGLTYIQKKCIFDRENFARSLKLIFPVPSKLTEFKIMLIFFQISIILNLLPYFSYISIISMMSDISFFKMSHRTQTFFFSPILPIFLHNAISPKSYLFFSYLFFTNILFSRDLRTNSLCSC